MIRAYGVLSETEFIELRDKWDSHYSSGSYVSVPDYMLDNFRSTGTASAHPHFETRNESGNCVYCHCRIFPTDRWCPSCGGPIYD